MNRDRLKSLASEKLAGRKVDEYAAFMNNLAAAGKKPDKSCNK